MVEAEAANSSSFWNRQTTLFTIPWHRGDGEDENRRSTPIWTGWENVNPEGTVENGRAANGSHARGESAILFEEPHSPGEGSPRGSGEEADPFLTRRSIRSTTVISDEKNQTRSASDTLVSVPVAAAKASEGSVKSSPQRGGHIIPRELQRRIAEEEEDRSPYSIRIVEATPHQEFSPLVPPPPLNPDGLIGRRTSNKSINSHRTQGRSLHSEKSTASLEADPAELLIARRVRVGELGQQQHSRLPTIESETDVPGPSTSSLGLTGLTGRLGRLSWFRRLSSSTPGNNQDFTVDPYTRTPPRSSRQGSHSRPGSWARIPDHPDPPNTPSRGSRGDPGIGAGLLAAISRPISSISARTQTTGSRDTVYYDARSRPATPATPAVPPFPRMDFPMPVTSPEDQARLARSPTDDRVTLSDAHRDIPWNPPPAYDDTHLPRLRSDPSRENIDVLDLPAPAPTSAFASGRPAVPPGLQPSPLANAWRDSYATNRLSADGSRDSAGIQIDIEDEPPEAQETWRDMATDRDGRRRTFGVVSLVGLEHIS